MTKVFFSHSSRDTRFAQRIAQFLVDLGVLVWIDVAGIRAGEDWGKAIQRALDRCELMLLLISPDSMASDNVTKEWQYYLQKKKLIIPLLMSESDIHFQLNNLQYIDFIHPDFTVAFTRLCLQLQVHGFEIGSSSGQLNIIRPEALYSGDTLPVEPAWNDLGGDPEPVNPSPWWRADDVSTQPLERSWVSRISEPAALAVATMPRVEDILPPPFEWIDILDGVARLEDGRLRGETRLPAFRFARYPITDTQYDTFLAADDGYRDERWWDYSDGARRWRAANPYPRRSGFHGDDDPRTDVSWYEAVAFSRWLSWCVGAGETVARITLPTVQQWHCAAVADTGWSYPWGERFLRNRANTLESGIERTTPVTAYPDGASPYGVMDMSGNCAEWCLNDWVTGDTDVRHEAEQRFVLGGSWRDDHSFASVWHRPCRKPGVRKNSQGFRLAMWL